MWEMYSLQMVIQKRRYINMGLYLLHYLFYYTLGWKIVVIGVLLSGAVAAFVVTSNH